MAEIFQRVPCRSLKPGQFRSKAQGERQDLHTRPARNQKVAELVKENNDGEDKKEWNDVTD